MWSFICHQSLYNSRATLILLGTMKSRLFVVVDEIYEKQVIVLTGYKRTINIGNNFVFSSVIKEETNRQAVMSYIFA